VSQLGGRVELEGGVAEVQVALTLRLGGGRALAVGSAKVGRDGRYSIAAVPPGAGELTVRGQGWASLVQPLWVEPGQNPIEPIRLVRAAPISGTVRDDEGQPVAAARIRASPLEGTPGPGGEASSDRAGRFQVDHLHPGDHVLSVEAKGYLASGEPGLAAPAAAVELRMTRLHRLHGRVEGAAAGRAIRIWIAGSGVWPARSVPAARDGSFTLEGIPAGAYELVARSEGAPFLASEILAGVQVGGGASGSITLRLTPAERLLGQLLDGGGAAIARGELSLGRSSLSVLQNRVRTDAEGRFAFQPEPSGRYQLSAWAPGFLPVVGQDIQLPRGEPLILRLSRGATLKGSLNDPDGNPVADGIVTVRYRGGAREGASGLGELGVIAGPVPPIPPPGARIQPSTLAGGGLATSGVSDAQGRFALAGLQPGRELRVVAEHPGFERAESEWLLPDAPLPELRLVLRPGCQLAGQILDESGRPVEGAQVTASGERGSETRTTVADRFGRYSLGGLAAGRRVTVSASSPGRGAASRTLSLRLARQELDLVLEPALGRVEGVVYAPGRLPLAGASVRIKGGRSGVTTDAAGRFELTGIGRRAARIEVRHPSYAPAEVRAEPGDVLNVELRLLSGIAGSVSDERTGLPVTVGSILWEAAGQRQRIGFRDLRGGFRLAGIPAGPATLTFEVPGYAQHVVRLTLEEPRQAGGLGRDDLRVVLKPAGTIEGQLTELVTGAGVHGASVSAGGVSATTSGTGEFRLARVPEGLHTILVRARDGRTGRSDPLTVRAGETTSGVRILLR
jgi:hypothetical protein